MSTANYRARPDGMSASTKTVVSPHPLPSGVEILARLRGVRDSLPPAERLVADHVLADPAAAATLTMAVLADRAGTSVATVQRLCRSLGLAGYPVFRLALARAGAGNPVLRGEVGEDIAAGEGLATIVEKIGLADARAVQDTVAQLDVDELDQVVDAVIGAARIDLYGVGASAFVAMDLQQKLHRIGRVSFAWHDPHMALTSAALLGAGDVAIGISHTGSTTDVIQAVSVARDRGATTVALTNGPRSPLARHAAHMLTTATHETTYRSGAMASRIAQLVVIDALFVGVAARDHEHAQRALESTFDAVKDRRVSDVS